MKQIFSGIYQEKKSLFTENLRPGQKVYGESLIKEKGKEFREWNPNRSKLAAAIKNGLKEVPLGEGKVVLYLGAATGTTSSHVSDIIGEEGTVFCVEFSERMMRELLKLCEKRKNMVPMLADARKPKEYEWIGKVDVVYEDVAQPDQTEIAIRNVEKFLKKGGYLFLAVKSRSIDVTKKPEEIYKEEIDKLKKAGLKIIDWKKLDPYEKDHCMILAQF